MFSLLTNPLVIGIAGAVLALILVAVIVIRRYRIANPDEAIIVTGRKGKAVAGANGQTTTDLSGQKVVTGGGIFVLPFVQKSFTLSLRSRQLSITTTAQTSNGITIQAQAVAVVKVGGEESMIRAAAQRFLSQQGEIESSTQEVLSGSLRGIIGSLTVENIIQDRAALASAVLGAAEDALTKQGLVVDTLQIQEIRDNQDYIVNLGRPEAANVRRKAEVADTEATRASEEAKIDAQKIILNKNRELQLQEATIQQETDKARAEAQAAKPLEDAIQRQQIVAQEEITAGKEAALKEQKLNAEIRKVADAEAYRITAIAKADAEAQVSTAEGNAKSEIARADAERQRRVLAAVATEREGLAQRESRKALAEATAAEGVAEASAIEARGLAEAKSIEARGKALAEQSQAVLAQQALEILPKIAAELAAGYGSIDNLTVVSADGANKLTGDIVGNVKGITTMLKDATGIDVAGLITGVVTGTAAGNAMGKAQGSKSATASASQLTPQIQVFEHTSTQHEAEVGETLQEESSKAQDEAIHNVLESETTPVSSTFDTATVGTKRVKSNLPKKPVSAATVFNDFSKTDNRLNENEIEKATKQAKSRLDKIENQLASVSELGLDYTKIPQLGAIRSQIGSVVDMINSASGLDVLELLVDYPRVSYLLNNSI